MKLKSDEKVEMDQDNAAKTGIELFDSPRSREEEGDNICSTPTIKKYSNRWKLEEISHVFIPESMKKRTKSRANKRLSRQNSLKESKVLMVTEMRRTESTIQPELFQFNSHFEFLSLIGQTRTSEVFRVRHRFTGELFAVKRSRQRFRSKLERERCLREIVSVSDLPPHPNIVGQYRAWQEDGLFYIQMDLCEGGTLMDFVRNFGTEPIPDTTIWQIAVDIATGLEFLHSNNVLHLDIKPDNIYRGTDEKGQYGPWRIGDFGLAVAKQSAHWEEGDGDYVAPELLKHRGEPSSSADIFSFGATLYECATKTKLPKSPATKNHNFLQETGRSELLMTLIRAMTLLEANARPSASQVKSYALACLEGFQHQDMSPEEYLVNQSQLANLSTTKQLMQTSFPGHSRWLPSLSPLPSEGALTPGAAAGLVGLTPSTKGNGDGDENSATKSPNLNAQEDNKSRQASQMQLPLQTNEQLAAARKTNETSWSSFQIRKLDSQSNVVEFPCSASESISFGTGSISDLEFPDLSPPMSNGGDNKWFENLSIATQMQKSPELTTNSNPILDEELNRVDERGDSFGQHGDNCQTPLNDRVLTDSILPSKGGDNRLHPQKSPFENAGLLSESALSGTAKSKVLLPNFCTRVALRKRQHSSRRALANSLEDDQRETSTKLDSKLSSSSSIQALMPHRKGARHADLGSHELLLPEKYNNDKANENFLTHNQGLDATAAAFYMTNMSLH